MRLKKAHTHIKNYNCNKTPLLHKKCSRIASYFFYGNFSVQLGTFMRSHYYYMPWLSIILFKLLVNCLSTHSKSAFMPSSMSIYIYSGARCLCIPFPFKLNRKKFLCYCYQLPWQWGRKFFRFSFIQTKRWSLTWKMRDEMKFFQWFILKVTFSVICYR